MVIPTENKIRVSVAMISYNGANYIREQIDSILIQLKEMDELVISDDGSTDGTLEIIKSYQQLDKRIHLLKGPRLGIKKNVEYAVSHSKGTYIFLADQDDIWMSNKIERVLQAFEKQKTMVVIHDAKVFERENLEQIVIESFFSFRGSRAGVIKNIVKNSYIGCCMAFRQELKEIILPIPSQIEMHDQWIGALNDYRFGKSCFLPEALLLYRRHGNNNSSMTHYNIGKMLRNRVIFFGYFFIRILHIRQKKHRNQGKFKKK
ncbi:MAG: glycosyltransferase family 2 protein [Lachnospiraceae bacterium]